MLTKLAPFRAANSQEFTVRHAIDTFHTVTPTFKKAFDATS